MLEWILNNKQWIFGGIGITICGAIITKILKILNNYFKIINEHNLIEKLKKDLEYDNDNGVYYKINHKNEKEIYCPLCLVNDKKLFHLVVDKFSADGNLFKCNRCGKLFGKGFRKLPKCN